MSSQFGPHREPKKFIESVVNLILNDKNVASSWSLLLERLTKIGSLFFLFLNLIYVYELNTPNLCPCRIWIVIFCFQLRWRDGKNVHRLFSCPQVKWMEKLCRRFLPVTWHTFFVLIIWIKFFNCLSNNVHDSRNTVWFYTFAIHLVFLSFVILKLNWHFSTLIQRFHLRFCVSEEFHSFNSFCSIGPSNDRFLLFFLTRFSF